MNRYTPDIAWTKGYEDTPIATMFPDESGEYVRYEDIIRIINRMVCDVTGPIKPAKRSRKDEKRLCKRNC